ncbi:MAG: hypothetical protein AAGF24_02210 [Cyanobacteria bacterium P01_H01_bin.121]
MSCRFYRPEDPNNPSPGVWGLRHVSLVQIPAVKGMEPPSFGETTPSGCVDVMLPEVSFAEFRELMVWREESEVTLKDLQSEYYQFGHLTEDAIAQYLRAVTADEMAMSVASSLLSLKPETIQRLAGADSGPEFAEPSNTSTDLEVSMDQKALDDRQAALDARSAELDKRDKALQRQDLVQFCEGLKANGQPIPVEQGGLVDFMQSLDASEPVQFGEAKTEVSRLDWFKSVLPRLLPKKVEFAESPEGVDVEFAESDQKQKAIATATSNYERGWRGKNANSK